SAEPGIAGVDENHTIDDDGRGGGGRAAVGLDSVDSGIRAGRIEIPENLAIFGCKSTDVAVEGSRENHARQRRNRTRLRGTATGPRGIAGLARHEPGFRSVVQVEGGKAATLDRIERGIADRRRTSDVAEPNRIGDSSVYLLPIARHSPLYSPVPPTLPDARLPNDSALLIRIESINDARLLTRNEQFFSCRSFDEHHGRAEIMIGTTIRRAVRAFGSARRIVNIVRSCLLRPDDAPGFQIERNDRIARRCRRDRIIVARCDV